MFERAFYFLILFFFLHTSISFAASPGINLINDPNSHKWVPDPAVKNWMTIIPENPEGLARFNNLSASNVVIRIHAWWTDTGKRMLSDDSSQQQTASGWCNVLNSYGPGKTIYVEPFNELEQDYERASLSGSLNLDTAIERANSFINKLQSCLTKGTIISPALDPQNANFPKTSAAFSRFSIISYHPYLEETARNYRSGFPAGKQFIFTEVGVVVNGYVVYDDCELIKYFCGKGITAFWKGQDDILAYTLFTFSPGDYAGSWKLINPKVTDALKATCPATIEECTTKTDNLGNPNRRWPYIPAVKLPDKASQGIDTSDPRHPEVKTITYSNTLTENVYACDYPIPVEKTVQPIDIGGTGAPQYAEQNITSIEQIKINKAVTNPGNANFSEQFAKGNFDINATGEDRGKELTNYGDLGGNTTQRVLPYLQILIAKGELLKEASLSLNPDHKYDVIGTDEPLGYSCNGQWNKLFPKPSDPSCRRVAISEVAWNFVKRGKPFLYELKEYGQIASIPTTEDIIAELSRFYNGGGYAEIWGKPFTPMSDDNYDKLYENLPIVPRGTVNTRVEVNNTATGSEVKTLEKAEPLMGPISSAKSAGQALSQIITRQQEITISTENGDMICKKVEKKGPTIDEGSKLSFLAQVAVAIKKVFTTPETISGSVQATLFLPASTVLGLEKHEKYLNDIIPNQDNKKYQFENVPNSSTDGIYPSTNNKGGVEQNHSLNLFLPYKSL